MVVAFLSIFVAVVSVVAQQAAWLAIVPNLAAASVLFVFGVGSYMIEILYLTTAASKGVAGSPDGHGRQSPMKA